MIQTNIIHFGIDSSKQYFHIFHNRIRVMLAEYFVISNAPAPPLLPAGLPASPSAGQFWAIMVWVLVPMALSIWVVYHHQQERLRKVHRRLRQLEAQLCATTPGPAVVRKSLPRPARPSSLTARILLPASAESPSPFAHPTASSGH